jgi:hypothetical protein
MGRIVITPDGGFEGETQDIIDFFQKSNSNIPDFLKKKNKNNKKEVSHLWVGSCIFLFFACSCWIWIGIPNPHMYKIAILASFLFLCGCIITIHVRFDNYFASTFAGVFGIAIIAVATGLLTPKQAVENLTNKVPPISRKIREKIWLNNFSYLNK